MIQIPREELVPARTVRVGRTSRNIATHALATTSFASDETARGKYFSLHSSFEACRPHGKHLGVGGLASNPKLAGEFVRLGARYVSTGTDLSFLLSAATARAAQMREQ